MPQLTADEVARFLDEPGHLVRIGTVDGDGMPRVVPTWFLCRDDRILFTPRAPAVFLGNLRRDPRIGLSVDEQALPYRKITVQGRAEILHEPGEDDLWRDVYRAIALRYLRADAADAYLDGTRDQPRALVAVDLASARFTTWRLPDRGEDLTGIWHHRYYADGSALARRAGDRPAD
ncbi:MAG: hypothetical protein FJW83_05145 [Actinobacteria bacterium]|nr:hypothetical protein [Actinomycetota bacterium]